MCYAFCVLQKTFHVRITSCEHDVVAVFNVVKLCTPKSKNISFKFSVLSQRLGTHRDARTQVEYFLS
jgi:hypothetical protein